MARHLVASELLMPDDPETAYEHAKIARRLAARIGAVREAVGVAAYYAGEWADALSDLRAARRLTGVAGYLPMMADCERGLGRPERALSLIRSEEAKGLQGMERVELAIVESGARSDLGELDAAVLALKIPELTPKERRPWSPRLFYAYAEALLGAGRESEATQWFARAAAVDDDEETDAAERHAELVGGIVVDAAEDEDIADTEDAENIEASLDGKAPANAEDAEDAEDPEDVGDGKASENAEVAEDPEDAEADAGEPEEGDERSQPED